MKKLLVLLLSALLLVSVGCDTIMDVAEVFIVDALEESESSSEPSEVPLEQSQASSESSEAPSKPPEVSSEPFEAPPEQSESETESEQPTSPHLDPDGVYTTKEDVALYLYLYDELPGNFITKKEARALGWESGGLDDYADGKCIGGDRFGNYEGLLPEETGRTYFECDIDTLHQKKRGAKRIVFSNDGLIYFTENHYESFELLYGEE